MNADVQLAALRAAVAGWHGLANSFRQGVGSAGKIHKARGRVFLDALAYVKALEESPTSDAAEPRRDWRALALELSYAVSTGVQEHIRQAAGAIDDAEEAEGDSK